MVSAKRAEDGPADRCRNEKTSEDSLRPGRRRKVKPMHAIPAPTETIGSDPRPGMTGQRPRPPGRRGANTRLPGATGTRLSIGSAAKKP